MDINPVGHDFAHDYNILAFGAVGDGRTDDAPAIQRAIDACSAAGGGRVLVPAGRTFRTSTLLLKSHIELHLQNGSRLLAGDQEINYPPELRTASVTQGELDEGREFPDKAFIFAYRAENLAITGGGVIDGNGRAFVAEDLGHIYRMHGPSGTEPQYLQRPFTLFLIGCRNLTLREFTIQDAAFWTVRLTGCQDVLIHGLRIDNDLKLPNNDGLDIDRCQNVRISDCHIVAGDDAICLKACRAASAFGPCENITVTGCTVMSTSSGLKIGNECCAPIRNVIFSACVVQSSHRGLSIHLGEEGDVENVLFSDILVETRLFHEAWWGRGEPIFLAAIPWDAVRQPGRVRHVRYSHILARAENGACVVGWQPGLVADIRFEDVRIELDKWSKWPGGRQDLRPNPGEGMPAHPTAGFFLRNASQVSLRDCQVAWGRQPPEYFRHALESHSVRGLKLENFLGSAAHPEREVAIFRD